MPDSDFIIFPAIDLRCGRVVRLQEGDPLRQTEYDGDPAATALRWLDCGASWLHVVNLDGAFGEGDQLNQSALERILQAAGGYNASVQFGGGLRSLEAVERALAMGVERVVLGTLAVEQPGIVAQALARWGAARVALGLDARRGIVRVRGWQAGTIARPGDLARRFWEEGLEWLVFTDIERDGMQGGVNLAATLEVAAVCGGVPARNLPHPPLKVIASGGVRDEEDITAARCAGLAGIIVGRALYEGKVDLKKVLKEA